MKKSLIVVPLMLLLISLTADAQWRSKTHDQYNALQAPGEIKIDGEFDDDEGWQSAIDTVKGTDGNIFCEVEFAGNDGEIYVFREWSGGKWNGRDDHRTCFAIFWDSDAIYLGLLVTDDEHEHAAGQAWNGDGAQIGVVPSGKRDAGETLFLYNAGLDNSATNVILGNERTNGQPGLEVDEDIAIVRNESEKETYYEFRLTPEHLGLTGSFKVGYEFGLAICVNDGDKNDPGQKGWSGWYTDCIVNGPKTSQDTGLVVLTDNTLAVEASNKLTITWGNLKK